MQETQQTFDQYLSNKLSKSNYDNLHTILSISKRRCTNIKQDPNLGNIQEAIGLAKLLNLTTKDFITGCRFGFEGIPTGDYIKLK